MMNSLDFNNESYLTLNGKRFHYIWLRDNCLSSESRHLTSLQKIYDLSDSLQSPKPKNVEIQDEKLIIDWNEEPNHRSIFPLEWLFINSYDGEQKEFGDDLKLGQKQLWDRAWFQENTPTWFDLSSCSYETWLCQLNTLGFTILKNIKPEQIESFVSSIGPVYSLTQKSGLWTVKASAKSEDDLSYSAEGYALSPHVDASYMQTPPLVQFLYCVENNASGGESVVVDGFRIAEEFRDRHPEQFKLLTEIPVVFEAFKPNHEEYYLRRSTPAIVLNNVGEVKEICFNFHKARLLDIPFDKLEDFYEAYFNFFCYVKNPDYQYNFRLVPGDCLLVQNHRILHGRNAFDASSGGRELKVAYVGWEYFTALWRFQKCQQIDGALIQ